MNHILVQTKTNLADVLNLNEKCKNNKMSQWLKVKSKSIVS